MPRIKPYSGASASRLSTLIRKAQNPPLPEAVTFTFGAPAVGTVPVAGATVVDVTASVNGRQEDPVAVDYKRLSGDALHRLPPGELVPFNPITFPTTMHAILPQINEGLGLNLTTDEVLNVDLPNIPVNGITLTIRPASLAWLPGEYFYRYAPNSVRASARGAGLGIPTDERRRIRVLEVPPVS